MRLEITTDFALIRRLMTHPALYPGLSDDFYPAPEHFVPNESPAIVHLLAFDGDELLGMFMTHPINRVLWEVHHALLPSSWGRRAHTAGKAYLAWLWEMTPAQKVVGFTPASNRLALRYARSLGLAELGRIARCYQRGFELHDLVIVGKDRPKET